MCSSHQGCGVLALLVHRGWKHMHACTHLYTYTCIHTCLNPCTYTCICTSQNYEFTSISPVSKPSLQGSFLSFPILCVYLPSSQLRKLAIKFTQLLNLIIHLKYTIALPIPLQKPSQIKDSSRVVCNSCPHPILLQTEGV